MRAPIPFHLGEKIGLIDPLNLRDGLFDRLPFYRVDLGILRHIETIEQCRDAFSGLFLARIWLAQNAHRLSLDVGKVTVDEASKQCIVDSAIRVAEDMTPAGMGGHAIHSPGFPLLF